MRPMLTSVAIFSSMISVSTSLAQDCTSVIALSKQVTTVVSDKLSVDQYASRFCSEYARSITSGSTLNVGASLKFLSLSFGSSNASADEVASKYCSASDLNKANTDAYKQYIESISPGAYHAYQQCLEMSAKDLSFNVDLAQPREFHLIASYVQSMERSPNAKVKFVHSEGVKCYWDRTQEKEVTIPAGTPAVLTCERTDETRPSNVTIVRTDSAKERLTLPWQAFDKQGYPINTLKQLQEQTSRIDSQLGEVRSELKNLEKPIRIGRIAHGQSLPFNLREYQVALIPLKAGHLKVGSPIGWNVNAVSLSKVCLKNGTVWAKAFVVDVSNGRDRSAELARHIPQAGTLPDNGGFLVNYNIDVMYVAIPAKTQDDQNNSHLDCGTMPLMSPASLDIE